MSSACINVIYGGASIGMFPPYNDPEYNKQAFQILQAHEVKIIDTAQAYGESEKALGELKAGDTFTIDTKWPGGVPPGWATKDNILRTGKESVQKLGVKQFDIFYLHSPDSKTPLSETLSAVNEAYQLGFFRRFGLSNFLAEDVQKVYDHAKEHGYILPTVYQGNYNPVARLQETVLFPTLRKLGIAFYAYSPLAGGFLTKTAADIEAGKGRFNDTFIAGMYKEMYVKSTYVNALAKWEAVAEAEGVTRAELAYRWVAFNPLLKKESGDGIVIGARSNEQLEKSLVSLAKGKLSEQTMKAIDDIWEGIKHEAPYDNFNRSLL